MKTLLKDLAYGARMLRKSPGFTAAAVATLALGIGANTAIFSVVNGVLLRPLQYADADRLVMIWENNHAKGWDTFSVAPANFVDWRQQAKSFAGLIAAGGASFTLTGADEPELLEGARVSADLFSVLGMQPMLGRGFLPEEDVPGKNHVVVLGHGLWQRRFGGDPAVVGRGIVLGGEPYTIVGVAAPEFTFRGADLYAPIAFSAEELSHRGSHYTIVVGRLASGATLAAAQTEMDGIADRLRAQYPDSNAGWGTSVISLQEQVVGGVRPALLMLLGAVAFVLLICCANVANLLLARGVGRHREIAIRAALGAGRARIVRQLLTESVLLAAIGGGLGVLLAAWGIDLLQAANPDSVPRLRAIGMDTSVAGFTVGLSLLTGLLFGLYPALQASRSDLSGALKEGGRTGEAGVGRRRARSALVVSEVALALVLLIGAGLMLRSFDRVLHVAPGFRPEHVLTLATDLPAARYAQPEQRVGFYRDMVERLRVIPGVEAAAAVTYPPLSGGDLLYSFQIEGRPQSPDGIDPSANYAAVTSDYFRVLGIPLLRGRAFSEQDSGSGAAVAIIDETFARRFFPGEDPIGKRVLITNSNSAWREIVGVVGSVTHYALESGPTLAIYEPHAQNPVPEMTIVLRTPSDPAGVVGAAKAAFHAVDPMQPVASIRTMEEVLSAAVAPRRFPLVLIVVFAGVALVLALLGLSGVIAYTVSQRTHEIGVRLALGACRSDVVHMIVRQGARLVLVGIGTGVVASLLLTQLATKLLFGVSATDPATFTVVPLLLAGAALLASWLPARRAAKVDPMSALRAE